MPPKWCTLVERDSSPPFDPGLHFAQEKALLEGLHWQKYHKSREISRGSPAGKTIILQTTIKFLEVGQKPAHFLGEKMKGGCQNIVRDGGKGAEE